MSGETSAVPGQDTVTYRGRSLQEILPKIREDLGPDAIIERQRTGLIGGVGGFFQREMVEVEARAPAPGEIPAPETRLDVLAGVDEEADLRAATAPVRAEATPAAGAAELREGLQAPGLRRIVGQSEPFAGLLAGAEREAAAADADAEREDADEDDPFAPWAAHETPAAPPPVDAPPPATAPPFAAEAAGADVPAPAPAEVPAAPVAPAARDRPAAADAHIAHLVAGGLPPALAASVVAEAVSHALPFAPGRGLKRQVRAILARRLPVLAGVGEATRVLALVGPAGTGKTRITAGLAAVYAAGSDLPVVCLTLRPADGGAELTALLEPHGVAVHAIDSAAGARALASADGRRALVLLDTPPVSPRDGDGIARLAADLDAAGVTEAHLVLAATVAAPVARAALAAFAPLGPAALVATHADETDHLGPLVEVAVSERTPLSYVAAGRSLVEDLAPADPAALAARLLP